MVNRTSGQIDPKTRTLMVEIDVSNRDMNILPGSFVQVSLSMETTPTAEVPVGALVCRGDKHFVAVVDSDNTVALRPVTVSDNDGKIAKLSNGVSAGERVALNIGDDIEAGRVIRPVDDSQK